MKRLIVCSDGTWSRRDSKGDGPKETNVAKIHESLLDVAPGGTRQVAFYDPGVGVDGNLLQRVWAGITGAGLEKNGVGCYRVIVENHEPGDEVFLFGFSRGAYTVRSTVGMIRKCGLLLPEEMGRLHEAYRFYRGPVHPDSDEAKRFRAAYAQRQPPAASLAAASGPASDGFLVPIRFLGVWDTVGRLGIPGWFRFMGKARHSFRDTALSGTVQTARHALAIDERRKDFEPTLWSTKDTTGRSVEQAWFAGTHSGVGGGHARSGLSDVALDWMRQAAHDADLRFDEAELRRRVRPEPKGRLVPNSLWWQLRPSAWRPIGAADSLPQSVHPAALARLDDPLCGYHPENLLLHLGRPLPPRRGFWGRLLRRGARRGRSPA